MPQSTDLGRRGLVGGFAGLSLGASASSNAATVSGGGKSTTLVAYFSRSGNTRVVAGLIQRRLVADLFEILPAVPYPEDYLSTVEEARRERDSGTERELKAAVTNMTQYTTVYLGFPIWGETTPPVVRAFLSAHNWAGKTLIPFVTHGGYGLGGSAAVLQHMAKGAKVRQGFVMEADQERRTMDRVLGWLGKSG